MFSPFDVTRKFPCPRTPTRDAQRLFLIAVQLGTWPKPFRRYLNLKRLQHGFTIDKGLVQTRKLLFPTIQTITQNQNSWALRGSRRGRRWLRGRHNVRGRLTWSKNWRIRKVRSSWNRESRFPNSRIRRRGTWDNELRVRLKIFLIKKHDSRLCSRGSSLKRHGSGGYCSTWTRGGWFR